MAQKLTDSGLEVLALERGKFGDTVSDFAATTIQDELRYAVRHGLFAIVRRIAGLAGSCPRLSLHPCSHLRLAARYGIALGVGERARPTRRPRHMTPVRDGPFMAFRPATTVATSMTV